MIAHFIEGFLAGDASRLSVMSMVVLLEVCGSRSQTIEAVAQDFRSRSQDPTNAHRWVFFHGCSLYFVLIAFFACLVVVDIACFAFALPAYYWLTVF